MRIARRGPSFLTRAEGSDSDQAFELGIETEREMLVAHCSVRDVNGGNRLFLTPSNCGPIEFISAAPVKIFLEVMIKVRSVMLQIYLPSDQFLKLSEIPLGFSSNNVLLKRDLSSNDGADGGFLSAALADDSELQVLSRIVAEESFTANQRHPSCHSRYGPSCLEIEAEKMRILDAWKEGNAICVFKEGATGYSFSHRFLHDNADVLLPGPVVFEPIDRGRGLAGRLVLQNLNLAKRSQKEALAFVSLSNPGSIKALLKIGYRVTDYVINLTQEIL